MAGFRLVPIGQPRRQFYPKVEPVKQVTVSENTEFESWEMRFPAKPSDEVRDLIKANGWKHVWRGESIWYRRKANGVFEFATALAERLNNAEPDPESNPDGPGAEAQGSD